MDQYEELMKSVIADFIPDPNKYEVLSSDLYWSIIKQHIKENQLSINTGNIKMKRHKSRKWRNGRKK